MIFRAPSSRLFSGARVGNHNASPKTVHCPLSPSGGPMARYHIAEINIGRIRAELDDPIIAGFVNRLDEINALADTSPGFVWRLQTTEGNATYFRPFNDAHLLLNMSVWTDIDSLRRYVYQTAHRE